MVDQRTFEGVLSEFLQHQEIPENPLTVRDYFAKNVDVESVLKNFGNDEIVGLMNRTMPHSVLNKIKYMAELEAKIKYLYADAMVQARGGLSLSVL